MASGAAARAKRVTPTMIGALERLEKGQSLRGYAHASTYWSLRRQGLIEDSDTITDAGREALAKARA